MAKNKKGADGRYRYRIYLGKADDGSKKFKSFTAPRSARPALLPKRIALPSARAWIRSRPKPP